MLTGKTPQRAGVPGNVSSIEPAAGMPSEQYTIAEMFKDAGYKTAHFGKWHLGQSKDKQPNAQGFDYSFGHFVGCIDNYSHYYYWEGPNRHDLYRNGVEVYYPGQYFPDLMVKEATIFIEQNKKNPFFIYFALNTPHYPYQGTTAWLTYYKNKGVAYPRDLYAAFISTMDDKIGELMLKLEDLGLRENTIIIFQSDNGYSTEERAHYGGGSAGILRGSKFSLFEGGIRVPATISWPAKFKAGEERNQMCVNADWMPTLAELCGIKLDTTDLDGRSLVPVILDKQTKSRHESGYCWQSGKQWAARKGNWKLVINGISDEREILVDSVFLVNLNEDQGERTNLATKYPEKVNELRIQFKEWLKRDQ